MYKNGLLLVLKKKKKKHKLNIDVHIYMKQSFIMGQVGIVYDIAEYGKGYTPL